MPETFIVTLDGAMLRRGFYLYVWEITPPDGTKVLYVGRTGDSSSPNAQSLFNRLGQNLGTLATSSMVRNNLEKRGIDPTRCQFDMVGFGPLGAAGYGTRSTSTAATPNGTSPSSTPCMSSD